MQKQAEHIFHFQLLLGSITFWDIMQQTTWSKLREDAEGSLTYTLSENSDDKTRLQVSL